MSDLHKRYYRGILLATPVPCVVCGRSTSERSKRRFQHLTKELVVEHHYLDHYLPAQQPVGGARICKVCLYREIRRHDKLGCCPPKQKVIKKPKIDIECPLDTPHVEKESIIIETVISQAKRVQECVFVKRKLKNNLNLSDMDECTKNEANSHGNCKIGPDKKPQEFVFVKKGSEDVNHLHMDEYTNNECNSLEISNASICIAGYRRLPVNTSTCLVKDCYNQPLSAVSDFKRLEILHSSSILIPPEALICDNHQRANIWPKFGDFVITESDFKSQHCLEVFNLYKNAFKAGYSLGKIC